jgi:hypothetical protein
LNNKISQLAKVVSKMNDGNGPDIVGVCEVGNICLLQVCTGLEWRTKLLADLATKESETIFDQKDLVLNSLKCQKRESIQFRSEQSFFMDSVT